MWSSGRLVTVNLAKKMIIAALSNNPSQKYQIKKFYSDWLLFRKEPKSRFFFFFLPHDATLFWQLPV